MLACACALALALAPALTVAQPPHAADAGDGKSVIPKIDPARMKANVAELASDAMNGRSFRSEDGKRAAEWVAAKLAEAGAKPLEGRASMLVPVERMPAASPNVVAWIPPAGPKPSGEYILVTAHYDHLPNARTGDDRIYNGADDNASGVCGIIAVAEALRGDALDVGVVFVGFTGEEAGLVGSRAFVEEETLPVARIRGMFNMDMISRQPDGAIRLDGGPKGKVLTDLLVRLAPQVPLEMKVDTHPDWLMRSDQGAFLGAGVPAVLFSCEDHEDYHKVTDHADRCDEQLMAKVAALVAGAVRTFAAEMTPRFDLSPLVADELNAGQRVLRVGRPSVNPPYWKPSTRRDPNRGLDHDVVQALAKRLKWTVEEKTVPEGGEAEALRKGEVDLIANGFRPTDERAAEFALTRPYFTGSGVGALVKRDAPIRLTADLASKRVGVVDATPEEAWALERANDAQIVGADGPIGMRVGRLEKGEIDALLGDFAALDARARRDPALRAVRLAPGDSVLAFRSGDRAVADLVSADLARMEASGELAAIHAAYGFVSHRVIGQDKGKVSIVGHDGRVEWEYPCPHNSHDLQVLANGNLLLHPAPDRIIEVTRDRKVVWEWTSRPAAPGVERVEIHGFQRLPDGGTMIAETGNLRILEVDAKGAITRTVPLKVERPDWHRDTRRVRKTAAGTYLVCHEGLGLVREYDAAGKVVWEYALDLNGQPATGGHDGHGTAVFNALRLPNGNTLIGGGNNNRVFEVTPDRKIVWSIERDELKRPDGRPIHLCWVTSLQVLPNGNIIFGNTHAGPEHPQMIEVTRDRKVVWTLDDWSAFGNDLCTGWCMDLPEGTIR
ncbi:MAG: M20/M25/M40 family metallo-hydrolase [Phycisphaerales bacterium]